MHTNTSADKVMSANDYTFEPYDDPEETRAWLEKFLREHNGKDWQRTLPVSITDLLTGNLPVGPHGQTMKILWYRIKYRGCLIGYADAKIHSIFNGRKVISDIWIVPSFRKRGHLHALFPSLVEYTKAAGICLVMPKYRLYGGWFESFGFDWLVPFGADPSVDPENSATFLITTEAFKDMLRFVIKRVGSRFPPPSERGRRVFEEVMREIEQETPEASQPGAAT